MIDSPPANVDTATTFYDRLKLAMDLEGRHPRNVADAMGVTAAALRGLKSTRGQARADNAMHAADYLKVNPRWLILGTGQMRGATTIWPFSDITPAQWEALQPDSRRLLEDVLLAYIDRHGPRTVK